MWVEEPEEGASVGVPARTPVTGLRESPWGVESSAQVAVPDMTPEKYAARSIDVGSLMINSWGGTETVVDAVA